MAISEAQRRATEKYKKKKYKRIALDVKVEEYEAVKKYSEQTGESINGFLRRLMKDAIEKAGI